MSEEDEDSVILTCPGVRTAMAKAGSHDHVRKGKLSAKKLIRY